MDHNNNEQAAKGCEFCGDFPADLQSRCHPSAPLRVEAVNAHEIALYCYVPECNRLVARFKLAGALH